MVNLLCSRCSRRREYHWTIILAVILVFLYTYLYNVHISSQEEQTAELYGVIVPDTRQVLDGKGKMNKKFQVDKPQAADKLNTGKLQEPHVNDEVKPNQVDGKLEEPLADPIHKVVDMIESETVANRKLHQDKLQVIDELQATDKAGTNITDQIAAMRAHVSDINTNEVITNDEKFPTFDLVMIIQVHRRTEYLKMLLESLRDARNISEVLLVVSFDYYDEELFSVVDKVDFCKVVKIFFPKSIQLHPNEFPGSSPNDCPRNIDQATAKKEKCTNAEHPDAYGHYREAAVTAIKHHWWWKINHLFDGMKVTASYNGYVIFLEEDLYVAPDIVPVTKQLISLRDQHCPDCDLIGLGLANKMTENLRAFSNKADILGWRNNLAYAIDRQSWNKIKKCSKEFCTFDDYNWDWTLQSLQASCYRRTMKAILLKAPRAYHTGTCGTHQRNHGDNCNWNEAVDKVRSHITTNRQYYFPTDMNIEKNAVASGYSYKKGFGGWGDPRDHTLCLSFVHDK